MEMSSAVSAVVDGSMVVFRHPVGGTVRCAFHDDGSVRDVTAFVADLVLIGLFVRSRQLEAAEAAGDGERVEVASVELDGPADAYSAIYLHLPSRETAEIAPAEFVDLLTLGIAQQVEQAVVEDLVAVEEVPSPDATSGTDA